MNQMLLTAIALALLIFLYVVVIDYLKARRQHASFNKGLDRLIEQERGRDAE